MTLLSWMEKQASSANTDYLGFWILAIILGFLLVIIAQYLFQTTAVDNFGEKTLK